MTYTDTPFSFDDDDPFLDEYDLSCKDCGESLEDGEEEVIRLCHHCLSVREFDNWKQREIAERECVEMMTEFVHRIATSIPPDEIEQWNRLKTLYSNIHNQKMNFIDSTFSPAR